MIRYFFKKLFLKHKRLFFEEAQQISGFLALLMKQRNTDEKWTQEEKTLLKGHLKTPRSLEERWHKKTGEPLNQGIGYSYMAAQIMFAAIEKAGTLDGAKVNKALGETDMQSMFGRVMFDKETQFHRMPVQFGQWRKVDQPWKWEAPVVFSFNDNVPATAKLIFPMPY